MQLHDALSQIADIRRQMERTRVFRGYRSATTLFTAGVAVLAAVVQSLWLPEPARHMDHYVALWVIAAVVCIAVVGVEIVIRYRRSDSSLQKELTLLAVQQFVPSLVVGGLLMLALDEFAHPSLWLLPGLWSVLFGQGILASRQVLPKALTFVGAFYLLWGLVCIGLFRGVSAFSPWAMGVPFGVGQAVAAGVLYWTLERRHEA